MDLELRGKTAIVTGGSRGIGKAIAWELAREGVDVTIVARDAVALAATARELAESTGQRILPVVADTGDDAAVQAMVAQTVAAFGRLDILVNCAALRASQAPPKLAGIGNDLFWNDVNVKVMGYLRCAREAAPHMVEAGWGRVINIGGLAARSAGNTVASIRNAGVAALTKNLAEELGPHGINVTCVHPGMTRTERTADMVASRVREQGISEAEVEAQMAAGIAVRRVIDARDIGYVVAFLASPRSIAITGDVIAAGGGGSRAIHY